MKFVPPLVEVLWDDAADEPGTWLLDDVLEGKGPEPKRYRSTAGRLCYVCAEYLTLMHDWDADDREVGNATTIFTGWIRSITHLRKGVIYVRTQPTKVVASSRKGKPRAVPLPEVPEAPTE